MAWMAFSRLRLNSNKTELIWLGAARYVKLCPEGPLLIAGAAIIPRLKIRDLGVMVDSDLSLKAHVQHVTAVVLFQHSATAASTSLADLRSGSLAGPCTDSQSSRLLQWHPGQCTAWSSQ